ncbi:MAG: iron chelate uptake ABC transporter family permease subunit [Planctomycetota bacterium]
MLTAAWVEFDLALDLFPLAAALLAVVTCGLLGNYLVLRRQSLMGDAISHAVLPGLVIAFLLSTSRSGTLMLVGATAAGVFTVVAIELVKRLGRVEPGAAMGVVFSLMFALGVLLIEQAAVRHVDLDADCVLYGQLETLAWFGAPPTWGELWAWSTVEAVPRSVWLLLVMCGVSFAFVGLLYKELRVASFDPELATSQGVHAGAVHYALMVLVAAATVASFEAVGSILVIAMLIAPAATARLLTDRLGVQLCLSLAAAAVAGLVGYFGATAVPVALHEANVLPGLFTGGSVNAAGGMTVAAGGLVVLAAVGSPSHGVVARAWRRRRLGREAAVDDLLAALYRRRERGESLTTPADLADGVVYQPARALRFARRRGLVEVVSPREALGLTGAGLRRAAEVMRRHRLWEDYLVADAGLRADHVHDTAERFEHLPLSPKRDAAVDPHGRPIPPPHDPAG